MEIEGRIIKVLPAREGTRPDGTRWKMQDYVLQQTPQNSYEVSHPRHMVFTVSDGQDGRISRLGMAEGRRYRVFFDLDAHEHAGRWYNSLRAYDAREVAESGSQPGGAADAAPDLGLPVI